MYLEDVVAKRGISAHETQRVSTDRTLWTLDRYRDFLQARREALAWAMNEFIRAKAGRSGLLTILNRLGSLGGGNGVPCPWAISNRLPTGVEY